MLCSFFQERHILEIITIIFEISSNKIVQQKA